MNKSNIDIFNQFEYADNLKMIIGAGNTDSSNYEDYTRFVKPKFYDVSLTNDIKLISANNVFPVINMDFNTVFMRGLSTKLKNKFHLLQFDFSTSKFYNGLYTNELLSLLKPGGKLIIDIHKYIGFLDNKQITKNLQESNKNNNNKFINSYSYDNEILNQMIKQNNIKHFQKNDTTVYLKNGRYTVPKYLKNLDYNTQMNNIDYIIVVKQKN